MRLVRSLSGRLLAAVTVLLAVFFGLTIVILEGAFERSAERAVEDRLNARVIMLLSAAETDDDGLSMPDLLPEPRFSTPGSGLIGQITVGDDERVWRSRSSVGVFLEGTSLATPGERRFFRVTAPSGKELFALSLGVSFVDSPVEERTYTFTAAESTDPFYEQVARFRGQLLGYFAALALLLLAAQATLLSWVLKPLRQVEDEIEQIEDGERAELSKGYPSELAGLTRNTNRLLRAERKRLARYRNTLGNLAHSLKTPLAVLRNTLDSKNLSGTDVDLMQQQIDRMNDIVGYQLQRAAASGSVTLGQERLDVVQIVEDIVESLRKVYAHKGVDCEIEAGQAVPFMGDKGDLMEILGNVLDNAFKWCARRVRVTLHRAPGADGRRDGFEVVVDDDGEGIDDAHREAVLARGARVDESVAGQGIGLAVVRELVGLLDGELILERSALGGARVRIRV